MNKKLGILGLMVVATVGLFAPAVASAQDRQDYRAGYGPVEVYHDRNFHDHDWRADRWHHDDWREREFREARERQIIREREWRERQRCERGYAPYYGYR